MPTRHRSFSSAANEEPATFDIDGETFTCVPLVPAAALSDVAVATDGTPAEQLRAAMRFMDYALTDESSQRLGARMRSKGGFDERPILNADNTPALDESGAPRVERAERPKPVTFPTLMEVFAGLIEEFSDARPTGGASGSPSGSNGTGPSSTALAPSGASTP